MVFIIRLQNLSWEATALDIRNFFQGLNIPSGGVRIIGGDKGEAFIAFEDDEDARMAMLCDKDCIRGKPVELFLSSKNEMHQVIENVTNQLAHQQRSPRHRSPPQKGLPMKSSFAHGSYERSSSPQSNIKLSSSSEDRAGFFAKGFENFSVKVDRKQSDEYEEYSNKFDSSSSPRKYKSKKLSSSILSNEQYKHRSSSRERTREYRRTSHSPYRYIPKRQSRERYKSRERIHNSTHRGASNLSDKALMDYSTGNSFHKSPRYTSIDSPESYTELMYDELQAERQERYRGVVSPEREYLHGRDESHAYRFVSSSRYTDDRARDSTIIDDFHIDDEAYRSYESGQDVLATFYPARSRSVSPVDKFSDAKKGRSTESCAYVSNLGSGVTFKDVRRFFSGISIPSTGVKLINDMNGVRTGCAYIMFDSREDRNMALHMNGEYCLKRKIKIIECPFQEFDNALDSFWPSGSSKAQHEHNMDTLAQINFLSPEEDRYQGYKKWMTDRDSKQKKGPGLLIHELNCVKISGLPPHTTKRDMLKFFEDFNPKVNTVYLEMIGSSKIVESGKGYMNLRSERNADRACQLKDQHFLGKSIAIEKITGKDMMAYVSMHQEKLRTSLKRKGEKPVHDLQTENVKDSKTDVTTTDKVKKIEKNDRLTQKPSVNMTSSQTSRKITEKPSSKYTKSSKTRGEGAGVPLNPVNGAKDFYLHMLDVPCHASIFNLRSIFHMTELAFKGIHVVETADRNCAGDVVVAFKSEQHRNRYIKTHRTKDFKVGIEAVAISYTDAVEILAAGKHFTHKQGGSTIPCTVTQPSLPGITKDTQSKSIFIRGIKGDVSVMDIWNFMAGYKFSKSNVYFKREPKNKPVESAIVTLDTKEEVERAVQGLNKKKLSESAVTVERYE